MRQESVQLLGNDDDEIPMVEGGQVPEVYCDGIASAERIGGENVRVTYYSRRRIAGCEVKMPVLQMVRPRRTCGPQIEQLLADASAEEDGERRDH